MTITQTVEIPDNRWLSIQVPREIPTKSVILSFSPTSIKTAAPTEADAITEKLNSYYKNHDSRLDDDLKTASYRLLTKEDW
ncbi:MAG: hypothetical protein FWD26_02550 [Treponema sp.]|nr:hypothetical protein [Treponema sp.]